VDQRSFSELGTAEAPRRLCRQLMAFSEPARMLAFAPFQGFIWTMSDNVKLTPSTVLSGEYAGE
jgi:hypothetical protein